MITTTDVRTEYRPRTVVDLLHQLMGGLELPEIDADRELDHWEAAERFRRQRNLSAGPAVLFVLCGMWVAASTTGVDRAIGVGMGIGALLVVRGLDRSYRIRSERALAHSPIATELPVDLADLRWLPVSTLRWRMWRRQMVADAEASYSVGRYMIATDYRPVPLRSQLERRRVLVTSSGPLASVTRLARRRRGTDSTQQTSAA